MNVRIKSFQTGKSYIVTEEVLDYYDSHPLPVVGMSRDFLRYIMGLARSTSGMDRREYQRLSEEIVDDAMNIYNANRKRNKRKRFNQPRGGYRGNNQGVVGAVAEELHLRRLHHGNPVPRGTASKR